jgi:CBS domain containing-hemolysin-like protein
MTLLILLLLCILGSGFFSGSEIGFVSWNRLKVSHAAARGDITANMGMRLIRGRGRLLTAILIGNNICNVGAALIFARLFERIDGAVFLDLSRIPSPESWFLTPVVLIFGEVLPKYLYRRYAFSMTMKSVPALIVCFYLAAPIFWVVGAFSKIFGVAAPGGPRDADVREEILLVAVEGARRGNIFESADRVMKNTLGMKGSGVGAFALGIEEWKRRHTVYRRSQLLSEFCGDGGPRADEVVVFDDDMRGPVGYVSLMDAAERRGSGGLTTFGALVKPLPRLREGMEALSCLRRMPPGTPRYHLVLNGNRATAILDKMALFGAAFAKS